MTVNSTALKSANHFVDVLRLRSQQQPDQWALSFLIDGDQQEARWTYRELDEKARQIAIILQELDLAGERAILLYPPGLSFVAALFGCFYAGVIAVPSELPRPRRPITRLERIAQDARPAVILTTAECAADIESRISEHPFLGALPVQVTDEPNEGDETDWLPIDISADQLAFIQYTSGSTSQPKGVMLSHANLLANSEQISAAFGINPHSRGISWLPTYHDMGLIGGILQPIFSGIPIVLLSPIHVVQHPMRWLRAISRFGATISGGPNFIYDRCVDAIGEDQLAELDLSRWKVAFSGAEPVLAKTFRRFADKFARCGFDGDAFFPCYGLAEATLLVSGGPAGAGPVMERFERRALESDRAAMIAHNGSPATELVGNGVVGNGIAVRIVNPETMQECSPGTIGEIWVNGPNVAMGYWNHPEQSTETFGTTLDDSRHYLRTGDFGFLHRDQVFVAGRIKDLIIIDGRNHYSQDIEQTVEHCHPALKGQGGVAFAFEADGAEHLAIVHEVNRNGRGVDPDEVIQAICHSVSEAHEIAVCQIALVKRGEIPRTSSGKVQRSQCRGMLRMHELDIIAEWRARELGPLPPQPITFASEPTIPVAATTPVAVEMDAEAIQDWLVAELRQRLPILEGAIDLRAPLASYGLTSRDSVEISGRLEALLQRRLSPTIVYEFPTIEAISQALARSRTTQTSVETALLAPMRVALDEPIAIVGLGCRFPGAVNPAEFWKLLTEGRDAIREVPSTRWNLATTTYRSLIEGHDPERTCLRWGGFLDAIDTFDAGFFGIAPREAMFIDPQQRLLLEVAWEALEDAGQTMETVRGSRTGVFMGISTGDYAQLCVQQVGHLDPYWATGNAGCIAANRLSYFFDLKGPSLAIDTACSSSLVATHLACNSLRNGECDVALAGGVNVILTPAVSISFAQAGGLAPDGRCKAFDARANGIVRSEGGGVVVLKRLSQALADGDSVYAIIRGSAVNQDGRSNGLTAPLQAAQEAVLREAYQRAGISPAEVQYIEAHGAGSALGDVMEAHALKNVLSRGQPAGEKCVLGSVKTNIGHLEAAAGIAGLIKVALSMKHRRIPANLHFHEPNPRIPFADMPFTVPTESRTWPARDGHRYAGISGFGFGGTNAHLVLESAPEVISETLPSTLPFHRQTLFTKGSTTNGHAHEASPAGVYLLPLSAVNVSALRHLAARWTDWLTRPENADLALAEICSAAAWHRSHHRERAAICFRNREELQQRLAALQSGEHNTHVSTGAVPFGSPSKLAFVFSGQGGQWWLMGRTLYQHNAVFRERIAECDDALRNLATWSLRDELLAEEADSHLFGTNIEYLEVNQVTQFALQVALAAVWKSWGVQPDAVVGHSFGEAAAACVAGALTLPEALRIVVLRSRLMSEAARTAPCDSGMAAVRIAAEDAQTWLRDYEGRLFISAYNSPKYTVVSGKLDALEELIEALRKQKIGGKVMPVPGAGHTPELEPIRSPLEAALADLHPQTGTIPFYSTVTGDCFSGSELNAAYWGRNLVQTVNFAPAVDKLGSEGFDTFVELGPAPLLVAAIHQNLEYHERTGQALASLRPKDDDIEMLYRAFGSLYVTGRPVNWRPIAPMSQHRVSLPTYPWQHERYWLESIASDEASSHDSRPHSGHPLLGDPVALADPPDALLWQSRIDGHRLTDFKDDRVDDVVIQPSGAILETALSAAHIGIGSGPWLLNEIQLPVVDDLATFGQRQWQAQWKPADNHQGRFQLHSRGDAKQPWRPDLTASAQRFGSTPANECADERAQIDAVRSRCSHSVDSQQFYDSLTATGQTIGPAFRVLQEIRRGWREAFGALRLPEVLTRRNESYVIHPALLEGCLHLAAVARGDADVWWSVPSSIESIRVWQHPSSESSLLAHCTARGEATAEAPLVADIVVWDEQHRRVLDIIGLCVQRRKCAEIYAGQQDPQEWLYEVQWRPTPLPPMDSSGPRPSGTWVLFADAQGIAPALTSLLMKHEQQVMMVTPGIAYRQTSPHEIQLDPQQPEHLRRLFAELMQSGRPPIGGIVNVWPCRAATSETTSPSLSSAEDALSAILHLVQAIDKTDFAVMPRLWFITNQAQRLPGDASTVSLEQAPLWGLGRTLQREQPNWRCTLIDLSADGALDVPALCHEFLADDTEDQLALRKETRYAARLVRTSPEHFGLDRSIATTPRFSAEATYLITGGLGGIGLFLAEWMIANGARHLVLMSRRSPDADTVQSLQALRDRGAEVVHAQGDLTNCADVGRTLDVIATSMPPLRGVLHCASALDDAPLAQMSPQQLKSVLASKTHGTWNLHELTQGLPLDFFVLFSSGAALLGPPGSANYAAGNAFLDALAEYRRQRGLPALAIGWGLWGDVGMVTTRDRQSRIKLSGFRTMPAATAARIMGQLMTSNINHLVVMPVDWAQLRRAAQTTTRTPFLSDVFAEIPDSVPEEPSSTEIAIILRAASPAERPQMLLDYLKNRLSITLGTTAEKIPLDRSLAALGVDSLLALELKNRVESELQITIRIVELLEGPTLQNLSASILKQLDRMPETNGNAPGCGHDNGVVPAPCIDDGKAAQAVLERIDELSDEETEALYQQMLAEEEGRA